jgi:adenine phosphoribosyltransferase
MDYKTLINEIPNFPIEGISFKDISPLIQSKYFKEIVEKMKGLVDKPDYWVGIDSRGFIFASAIAYSNEDGLIMCRKKGKLPPPVITQNYELEYGIDTLEIHPGKGKVIIVDDVYATGGTMKAVEKLCKKAGYEVIGKLVLIDLKFLHKDTDIKSLIQYE